MLPEIALRSNSNRIPDGTYVVLPPGSGFCPGSAHGRHLMGFDEDRSANLRCVVVMPLVRFLGLT